MNIKDLDEKLGRMKAAIANLDLYVYEYRLITGEDGRRRVQFTLTMPATQLPPSAPDTEDRSEGFEALVAQVTFMHSQAMATRPFYKKIEPLLTAAMGRMGLGDIPK